MNTFFIIAMVLFALAALLYIPWREWGNTDFRVGLVAAGLFFLTLGWPRHYLMFTASTTVLGVEPDMSLDQWAAILINGSALSAEDINQGYQSVVAERVSPAFCLAIFWVESHFGKIGICAEFNTKNPGNTRSAFLVPGEIVPTPQGDYVRYDRWQKGFQDLAARLKGKQQYHGLTTIGQLLPVYAPASDNNDPAAYVAAVASLMNGWLKPMEVEWIGSPNHWVGRWGEPVQGIVDHISQGVLNSNIAWFGNPQSEVSSTYEVAQNGHIVQYVSEADTAWANGPIDLSRPDGYDHSIPWLDECAKMGYNPNKRTISIEHEGFTGNAMPVAQYKATLALHQAILGRHQTIAAGPQGIIGHFQINKTQKPFCPGTGFPWQQLFKDLAAWEAAGGRGQKVEVPPMSMLMNGHVVGGGFLDFFTQHGGVKVFGLPLTEEYTNPITGLTEQVFQGEVFEYDAGETNPEWKVRRKIIGPMYIQNRGF
jgi:hypothetical protein